MGGSNDTYQPQVFIMWNIFLVIYFSKEWFKLLSSHNVHCIDKIKVSIIEGIVCLTIWLHCFSKNKFIHETIIVLFVKWDAAKL